MGRAFDDDVPEWLERLPAALRTHRGLIVLGAAGVAAVGAAIALLLAFAHVI
jgi:hypothetical protein